MKQSLVLALDAKQAAIQLVPLQLLDRTSNQDGRHQFCIAIPDCHSPRKKTGRSIRSAFGYPASIMKPSFFRSGRKRDKTSLLVKPLASPSVPHLVSCPRNTATTGLTNSGGCSVRGKLVTTVVGVTHYGHFGRASRMIRATYCLQENRRSCSLLVRKVSTPEEHR